MDCVSERENMVGLKLLHPCLRSGCHQDIQERSRAETVKFIPTLLSMQLKYKEFMVIYSLCWFSLQGFLFLVSLSCKGE